MDVDFEEVYREVGPIRGRVLDRSELFSVRPAGKDRAESQHFDAVVVASGRFNVPHIPAIEGLAKWQEKFPDKVYHSREYRRSNGLEGKTVLVVGASASATGISADINPVAGKSLLSVRVSAYPSKARVERGNPAHASGL